MVNSFDQERNDEIGRENERLLIALLTHEAKPPLLIPQYHKPSTISKNNATSKIQRENIRLQNKKIAQKLGEISHKQSCYSLQVPEKRLKTFYCEPISSWPKYRMIASANSGALIKKSWKYLGCNIV